MMFSPGEILQEPKSISFSLKSEVNTKFYNYGDENEYFKIAVDDAHLLQIK